MTVPHQHLRLKQILLHNLIITFILLLLFSLKLSSLSNIIMMHIYHLLQNALL